MRSTASELPTSAPARCAGGRREHRVGRLLVDLDHLVLDRAVAEHEHDGGRGRRQPHELRAAHHGGLGLGAEDDGGVVREPGEQVGGLVQHLLEATVGSLEEVADLTRRGGVDAPGRRQVVDEEPVALVGGDAPGRRVRLGR